MKLLGLDIGTNSVGSAWIDLRTGAIDVGLSVFPAGVDEADDKRGEPKNAKRRSTRRTRITLARRAERKRALRRELITRGLLPGSEAEFTRLLESTDPWELRRAGLSRALTPHEFGRVLLHLAQRRGALGVREPEDGEETTFDDGKVKVAIAETHKRLLDRYWKGADATKAEVLNDRAALRAWLDESAVTFGRLIADIRDERRTPIHSEDRRDCDRRVGPREWRSPVRNRGGEFQFHADRSLIRSEFAKLWDAQRKFKGALAPSLTDELRKTLDDETGDSRWRHRGLLFGQRRQSWDMGTLGRCVLEPSDRCAPFADMYASYYRVVETVNNLKLIEHARPPRPLTVAERQKVLALLRGPLGVHEKGAHKGKPKQNVSVSDVRSALGLGKAGKTSPVRLNIEADEAREINTDWFHRAIVHGAFGEAAWSRLSAAQRESVNKALLNFDPERDEHAEKLRRGAQAWWRCTAQQADALVAAWQGRPPLEKRLTLSRRAVRNLLSMMDAAPDAPFHGFDATGRWYTQIEARKAIAEDVAFRDVTTGERLHPRTRMRYACGAKGLTARDRHYMKRHPGSLPPAPMLTNPVVRKAIHEVRRHIVAHIKKHGCKPDAIVVELAREARMSAKDSDQTLKRNRLRERIRKDIIATFGLDRQKPNQQRIAVERVVLAVQQNGVCPLCGNQVVKSSITPRVAAAGTECELAHIVPRGIGGGDGLRNLIVAHTKCNRDMGRRTPRQFWDERFDREIDRVERMYAEIERINPKQVDKASADKLWASYFDKRDDDAKVANFKKDAADIQGFRDRDLADTRYATRQVLAYLADALYDGKGLPERGCERRLFTTDGRWTGELRREWDLFKDEHGAKAKELTQREKHARREKNRGDHRHHALDAIAIALTSRQIQIKFEERGRAADREGITAEQFADFCRRHPIDPPAPFNGADDLRARAMQAVYGDVGDERPVAHRAVKRKLIGALHEETLFGPIAGREGAYSGRKSVLALTPNHLRVPAGWDNLAAKMRDGSLEAAERAAVGRRLTKMVDPEPGKSGLVRDRALRDRLRVCIQEAGLDLGTPTPTNDRVTGGFTASQLKKLAERGGLKHASGVPIRSVVLLRAMSDPVVIGRRKPDHATGKLVADEGAGSARAYVGGNNHHIEIRVDARGKWSGAVVSAYEAAQRKLSFFRALREARAPRLDQFKRMPESERRKFRPLLAAAEGQHPLVDRSDRPEAGGRFVMSLCEGEMVRMRHKGTREVSYFVVAKLDKPNRVVLVPHWDARTAGTRRDAAGGTVADSQRESFDATPEDFRRLAPPGRPHAEKVRVDPLGTVHVLRRD